MLSEGLDFSNFSTNLSISAAQTGRLTDDVESNLLCLCVQDLLTLKVNYS